MRFAALHFFLPYIILAASAAHIMILHAIGSNNPTGSEKVSLTTFFPTFGVKDLFSLLITLILLSYLLFLYPNALGHPDNAIPAQELVTPAHIVPEWYFLPFYAILRSIPSKSGGVIAMFASLLILFVIPFLNTSPIRSATFRPIYSAFLFLFFVDVLLLGLIGGLPVEAPFVFWGGVLTVFYFSFFLILISFSGFLETRLVRCVDPMGYMAISGFVLSAILIYPPLVVPLGIPGLGTAGFMWGASCSLFGLHYVYPETAIIAATSVSQVADAASSIC